MKNIDKYFTQYQWEDYVNNQFIIIIFIIFLLLLSLLL